MTYVLKPSFARGELTPLVHARPDLAMFHVGLASCVNMIIMPQGGATKRPGWKRHEEWGTWTGDSCPVRLVPFSYSREDSMVLAMGDYSAMVLGVNGGNRRVMQSNISSPYSMYQIHNIKYVQSGNQIFMAHGNVQPYRFVRNSITNSSFQPLGFENGPWSSAPGDVSDNSVKIFVWRRARTQNDPNYDTTYMAIECTSRDFFKQTHEGRLLELSHSVKQKTVGASTSDRNTVTYSDAIEVGTEWYLRSTGSWTGTVTLQRLPAGKNPSIEDDWEDWRPHRRDNENDVGNIELSGSEEEKNILYRLKIQVESGTASATITANGFTKFSVFMMTQYNSPRYMLGYWIRENDDIDTEYTMTEYWKNPTADWRIGAWGSHPDIGYPRAIAFYQDRLCLAGNRLNEQGVWMSQSGDYKNFGSTVGNLKDDDAISITIAAEDMSGVHSLTSGADLMVFTSSSEWRIKGSGEDGAITPTAIKAHKQTGIGSAAIQPIDINSSVVMVQSHQNEVHILKYAFELDGYSGSNLSILCEHLFHSGREIVASVYQQIPDSLVWFLLRNGQLATCTFQEEHQVFAWARQETNGFVGSICSVPNTDGFDEVWAVVKRNGRWAIETLDNRMTATQFADPTGAYKSEIATLRMPGQSEMFPGKTFINSVTIHGIKTEKCKVSRCSDQEDKTWREIHFKGTYNPLTTYKMCDAEFLINTGFEKDAGIKVWNDTRDPMTILAITPNLVVGG